MSGKAIHLHCPNCQAGFRIVKDVDWFPCPRCREPIEIRRELERRERPQTATRPEASATLRGWKAERVSDRAARTASRPDRTQAAADRPRTKGGRGRGLALGAALGCGLLIALAVVFRGAWLPGRSAPDVRSKRPAADLAKHSAGSTSPTSSPATSASADPILGALARVDETPWVTADFLLVNPTHYAVAVEQRPKGQGPMRVRAKAEEERALSAVRAAFEAGVPILADDPSLARRAHASAAEGESLPPEIRREIEARWRPHRFLPPAGEPIAFNDLRRRRRRVGFRGDGADGQPRFRDLLGARDEPFSREWVQPGSLITLADEEAELRRVVDFLEFCLYKAVRALEARADAPDHVSLAVAPVRIAEDSLPNLRIEQLERDARYYDDLAAQLESREALVARSPWDVMTRRLLDAEREKMRIETMIQATRLGMSLRGESEAVARRGAALRDEATRLGAEIRGLLVGLGVPVLDREPQGLLAFSEPGRAETRPPQLAGASHVLYPEIRLPRERGRYQLAVRLTDVRTLRILWEGQGDRFDAGAQSLTLAASSYLLISGRPVVVEVDEAPPSGGPNTPQSTVGLPLRLGPVRPASPRNAEPARPAPETTASSRVRAARVTAQGSGAGGGARLGFREDDNGGDASPTFRYRDLFGTDVESVPRAAIRSIRPAHSLADVPPAHQMRYVIWRLARVILPAAGRITHVEGRRLHAAIGRRDGTAAGDRLAVIRPGGSPGSRPTPARSLTVEPIVVELRDEEVAALFEAEAGEVPAVGDLVHRKPRRALTVAIFEPPPASEQPPSLPRGALDGDERGRLQVIGRRFADLLQAALLACQVAVAERRDLERILQEQRRENIDADTGVAVGRLAGATHAILGRMVPGYGQAQVTLEVVDLETGAILETLVFPFTPGQLDSWKP